MSNMAIHRFMAVVERLTAISGRVVDQTRPTMQKRVRDVTDLTLKQAAATRNQGWGGLLGATAGLGATLFANAYGFGHLSKVIGTVCSQGGSIYSSFKEAEKTVLAGRANLLQNHFLPEGKKTKDEVDQFSQNLFRSLSTMQQENGRG